MASAALVNQFQRFKVGATITARLVSKFPPGWKAADGVPADASSQGTATVQTDGSVTITGLTAATKYKLTGLAPDNATTAFVDYYVEPPDPSAAGVSQATLDAAVAAEASARDAAIAVETSARSTATGLLLAKASNLSDVAAPGTSRGNLNVGVLQAAAAVATANVASKSGTTTIDGVSLVAGDIVLLTAQTAGAENGPWVIAAGAWTRPTDFASASSVRGRLIMAVGGTERAGQVWTLRTSTAVTVDTTSQTWALAAARGFSPTVVAATDAAVVVPAGATKVRIRCVGGGGGGGGGGGNNVAATAQAGGGGGGAGQTVEQTVSLGANTTLACTVGAGGTAGAAGAATGAGQNGGAGGIGGTSSVTGTGISVSANGGSAATGGAGNATTGGVGGAMGLSAGSASISNTGNQRSPGMGGSQPGAASAGGGMSGMNGAGGGGGAGGVSSTTLGGAGGAAGTSASGGAGGAAGGSGTSAGADGATATAIGAGGGGGGGASGVSATVHAGGAGGAGGPGVIELHWS